MIIKVIIYYNPNRLIGILIRTKKYICFGGNDYLILGRMGKN